MLDTYTEFLEVLLPHYLSGSIELLYMPRGQLYSLASFRRA